MPSEVTIIRWSSQVCMSPNCPNRKVAAKGRAMKTAAVLGKELTVVLAGRSYHEQCARGIAQ